MQLPTFETWFLQHDRGVEGARAGRDIYAWSTLLPDSHLEPGLCITTLLEHLPADYNRRIMSFQTSNNDV